MTKPTSSKTDGGPVMDAVAIRHALRRVAHEIIERNSELSSVVLAGIPSRGIEIAKRLASFIEEFAGTKIETGVIDVAMHRDDVGQRVDLSDRANIAAATAARRPHRHYC